MGALHEGHLALVAEGLEQADKVLVTIFVNARQFSMNEDLSRYPRDEAGDVAKLAEAGAHLIFAPPAGEVYGEDFATTVVLNGHANANLVDNLRPHYLAGVVT